MEIIKVTNFKILVLTIFSLIAAIRMDNQEDWSNL